MLIAQYKLSEQLATSAIYPNTGTVDGELKGLSTATTAARHVTGPMSTVGGQKLVKANTDYIQILSNPPEMNFTDASGNWTTFSLATWIYLDTENPTNHFIFGGRSAASNGYRMSFVFDGSIYASAGGYSTVSSANPVASGGWHHVAAVFDPVTEANNKIYVDGIDVTASRLSFTSKSMGTASTSKTLGLSLTQGLPLNGSLADARYYDHTLSLAEITEVIRQGNTENETVLNVVDEANVIKDSGGYSIGAGSMPSAAASMTDVQNDFESWSSGKTEKSAIVDDDSIIIGDWVATVHPSPDIRGFFEPDGTEGGKTRYKRKGTEPGSQFYLWYDGSTAWYINATPGTIGTDYFRHNGSTQSLDDAKIVLYEGAGAYTGQIDAVNVNYNRITEYRFGNPNGTPVFVQGGLHGTEQESPAILRWLAYNLINGTGSMWERLIDNFDFRIVPFANPEGYIAFARKNLNGYSMTADRFSSTAGGVDLNRNFDVAGWSNGVDDPTDTSYRGASAASETETQDLQSFFDNIGRLAASLTLDIHTNGLGDKAYQLGLANATYGATEAEGNRVLYFADKAAQYEDSAVVKYLIQGSWFFVDQGAEINYAYDNSNPAFLIETDASEWGPINTATPEFTRAGVLVILGALQGVTGGGVFEKDGLYPSDGLFPRTPLMPAQGLFPAQTLLP